MPEKRNGMDRREILDRRENENAAYDGPEKRELQERRAFEERRKQD